MMYSSLVQELIRCCSRFFVSGYSNQMDAGMVTKITGKITNSQTYLESAAKDSQPATQRLFQLERKVRCLHGRQCETLHALICGIRSQPRAVTDLSVCPSACLCLSRSSLPLGKERYFLPASASFVHREASSRDAM